MRAALFSVLQVTAIATCLMAAPGATQSQPSRPQGAQPSQSRSGNPPEQRHRFSHMDDMFGTGPAGPAFRQFMSADIRKHIPLLDAKIQSAQKLMAERQKLQEEKRRIAKGNLREETSLGRFHELLKREDALTSRQRALLPDTIRDADQIRAQIQARRSQIAADLLSAPDQNSSTSRNLMRADRVYEFMEERLTELQKDPNPGEWARPLMRGLLFHPEEPGGPHFTKEHRERRLRMLREEQRHLSRRLEEVRKEIKELSEDRPAGPGESRQPRQQRPSR